MKRLFAITLVCVAALLSASHANAQKYGVIGGVTFPSVASEEGGSQVGWNAGGTVQFTLPLGFAVQPSLVFDSRLEGVQLPVSLQWGPDLLVFRPYFDVSPYVGYSFSGQKGFEYGVGLGGGIEVWHLQVSCRYNWNLESVVNNYRGVTLSLAFLFGK